MIATRLFLRLPDRSFSFHGIDQNATDQGLYDFAVAVNTLQSQDLEQIIKIERELL